MYRSQGQSGDLLDILDFSPPKIVAKIAMVSAIISFWAMFSCVAYSSCLDVSITATKCNVRVTHGFSYFFYTRSVAVIGMALIKPVLPDSSAAKFAKISD